MHHLRLLHFKLANKKLIIIFTSCYVSFSKNKVDSKNVNLILSSDFVEQKKVHYFVCNRSLQTIEFNFSFPANEKQAYQIFRYLIAICSGIIMFDEMREIDNEKSFV